MGLPAMQAQRPEPTGETIGRAIEPWMDEGGFEVFDTLGVFFLNDKTWIFDICLMFLYKHDNMYI